MELTTEQNGIAHEIHEDLLNALKEFHLSGTSENTLALIDSAAQSAHGLYTDLKKNGQIVVFDAILRKNREVDPDETTFFKHPHAIEAFLRGIDFAIDESRLRDARKLKTTR